MQTVLSVLFCAAGSAIISFSARTNERRDKAGAVRGGAWGGELGPESWGESWGESWKKGPQIKFSDAGRFRSCEQKRETINFLGSREPDKWGTEVIGQS